MSAGEERAWQALRTLRSEGVHVVRQHKIGRCTVDFALRTPRIAIEIDGGVHDFPGRAKYDAERQAHLESKGWRFVRIRSDATHDRKAIIDAVRAVIPLPLRGGGIRAALATPHARQSQASAAAENMNELAKKLAEHIRENGPMTVAEYMGACLYDSEDGYYATRPAIGGESADFLTAPEASQMFGELIGLWCAHEWDALGKPAFNLIELGPGRGVLMQDLLRATKHVEAFHDAASVTLVETSAPLRDEQELRLPDAEWAQRLEDAPPGPALVIANEFLDCLPIRQFVRGEDGWHEKLVGLDEADELTFGLSAAIPAPESDDEAGAVREIAPALDSIMYEIERRLHAAPGRALFIDYGYLRPEGADTLQAVRRHKKVDPIDAPGEVDLTAHVDFARIAELANAAGLAVHGPITQALFLRALGIDVRAEALSRANPEHAERLARELHRLTHREEMGALFKVICLSSPNLPPPAGF